MAIFVLSAWLLLWGYVAASVVVTFTSAPSPGLIDAVFRAPGTFYLDAVRTLRDFALLTTVPARWTDVGYAAVSVVPLVIHFLVAGVGVDIAADEYWRDSDAGAYFLLVGIVLATVAVLGAALLGLGAQLLVVSLVAVGVALLTLGFSLVFTGS